MRIVRQYSHLNGLEYLEARKPHLWKEIVDVVGRVDASACRTKISREKTMKGRRLYAPKMLNVRFSAAFREHNWEEQRTSYWVSADEVLNRRTVALPSDEQKAVFEEAGEEAYYSYSQTDFVKDRVAVEVQFGKYSFVAFDLFVKHMAFYVSDVIDLGVEILPMKSLQAKMSTGPSYYERELCHLIREGKGVPAVPLILIGIAP